MKVKKIGHCCLIIETNGVKIMTDPGGFSSAQGQERDVHLVLITHEHGDHLHIDSLKQVIAGNPQCKIITNSAVKRILDGEGIQADVLESGQINFSGVTISANTCAHADIFEGIEPVQNTGYMIGGRLFYPGDALQNPQIPVEILALPIVAPWCKISEVLEYAMQIKPKVVFPVHDGLLSANAFPVYYGMATKQLIAKDIEFKSLKEGLSLEF